MSDYRLRIKPNWRPALSPAWADETNRLAMSTGLELSLGIERREDPTLLTYGDATLQLFNGSYYFDSLFDLDKITGTVLSALRAPLVHHGEVLICRRRTGSSGNYDVAYYGLIDPTQVRYDTVNARCLITAFDPAKLLEKGNAERVHRFSTIVGPKPYVILGYDLIHPAVPPGETAVSDRWWRLVGAGTAGLQFFKNDRFMAIQHVSSWSEGMETNDLGGSEWIVQQVIKSGADLYIEAINANGDVAEGLALAAGQAHLEHLNPWYHNMRLKPLLQLCLDEVNAAIIAAGATQSLVLSMETLGPELTASAVDLIDGANLPAPATAAGWYKDGVNRALAWASGSTGRKKNDVLQDAASVERPFNSWGANTAPVGFTSPDKGLPLTYANPLPDLRGTNYDIADVPEMFLQLHHLESNLGGARFAKISTHGALALPSYASAAATAKWAYRLEAVDTARLTQPANPNLDPFWRVRRGYVLGLYTKANCTHTGTSAEPAWGLSGSLGSDNTLTSPAWNVVPDPVPDAEGQGSLRMFDLGGGNFLYVLVDAGRQRARWAKRATDHETPANLITDFNTAGHLIAEAVGKRSAAVGDGTNIFFLWDRATPSRVNGLVTVTSASTAVTGNGTRFLAEVLPGDTIIVNGVSATVLSVTSDTALTLTANWGGATQVDTQWTRTIAGATMGLYYWNGTTFATGTLSGMPNLTGADWINAVFDTGRSQLYVTQGGTLWRLTYTFAAGTMTITSAVSAVVDTPNFLPGDDLAVIANYQTKTRPGANAWLAGPVDVVQGPGGETVNYPAAADALLVVTQSVPYIYSDQYGGVIAEANFDELSCSTAMRQLAQIPGMVVTAGADLDTVADPSTYTPVPTIKIKRRQFAGATPRDVTGYAIDCKDQPWIIQYGSIVCVNPKNSKLGSMQNQTTFRFNGSNYTVTATRYAGAAQLKIENPFFGTRSQMQVTANTYAAEILVPRVSGDVTIWDPHQAGAALPIRPLEYVTFLRRGKDHYISSPITTTARVLRAKMRLDDDTLVLTCA